MGSTLGSPIPIRANSDQLWTKEDLMGFLLGTWTRKTLNKAIQQAIIVVGTKQVLINKYYLWEDG